MINAIAAKLNVLGDEASITSNLEAIEGKINALQDKKDQAVVAMAREQSTIQLLDPDGSIQNSNTVTIAELNLAKKNFQGIKVIIDSLYTEYGIKPDTLESEYKRIVDMKNSMIIQNH